MLTHTVRSKDTWASFFQRKLGGSKIRSPNGARAHYSVHIFDQLGIAEYKKYFPPGSPNTNDFKSSLLNTLVSEHNKFEGEILERWAKHVLCAHIYIRQARNSREQEDLDPSKPLYNQRLGEDLLPGASYEALIPISAILSAFHKIVERYHGGDKTPLENIENQGEAEDPSRDTKATFEFTDEGRLHAKGLPPVSHQELVVKGRPCQMTIT